MVMTCVQRENKLECLGFFEMSCAGICHSEERLVGLYQDCVLNLGTPGAAGTLLQSAATMNNRAHPTAVTGVSPVLQAMLGRRSLTDDACPPA